MDAPLVTVMEAVSAAAAVSVSRPLASRRAKVTGIACVRLNL